MPPTADRLRPLLTCCPDGQPTGELDPRPVHGQSRWPVLVPYGTDGCPSSSGLSHPTSQNRLPVLACTRPLRPARRKMPKCLSHRRSGNSYCSWPSTRCVSTAGHQSRRDTTRARLPGRTCNLACDGGSWQQSSTKVLFCMGLMRVAALCGAVC